MNILFIADTHFGHRSICKYRPFKTAEEHDETLINNWNSVVRKKRNTVWVLGDFMFRDDSRDIKGIIDRLNGNINLITGNHDYLPFCMHNKINIMHGLTKKYKMWLSHCPIHPNELRGLVNIHGHVHSETVDDKRYINVSANVIGYTPISLDAIRSQL